MLRRLFRGPAGRIAIALLALFFLTAPLIAQGSLMAAPEGKLLPNPLGADNYAGFAVSTAGDRAAVGAYRRAGYRGSTYVFRWNDSACAWQQEGGEIVATDGVAGDRFGVVVSPRGDSLAVGAHTDDHSGKTDPGSAYVFERCGGVWIQTAKLISPSPGNSEYFGRELDFDGQTLVIGEYGEASSRGNAHVFSRQDPGTPLDPCDDARCLLSMDLASSTAPGSLLAGDEFGFAVAVEASRVAVGARKDAAPLGSAGSVYVFRRDDLGNSDPCDDVFEQEACHGDGPDSSQGRARGSPHQTKKLKARAPPRSLRPNSCHHASGIASTNPLRAPVARRAIARSLAKRIVWW